jgi:putative thioredoxin
MARAGPILELVVTVLDVTEASFATEVLERSRATPVVVDFWAEWCGPCRALGPLLEQAAAERDGQVVLAKVETDANPRLAAEFQIQGIPAVKAFRDGRVAGEFVGVQPKPVVEQFFDALLPSQADLLVGNGDEASLREALGLEPGRADAALPLARMLLGRGEREQARQVLAPVHGSFQADGLSSRLQLEGAGELAEAFKALDEGDTQHGLELLLAAMADPNGHRDDIRRVIVGELDALGSEHSLARDVRRRLATMLY